MYWTVLGIAFVGAVLTTSEGCVTSPNALSVNNSVIELTAGMAAIIANPPSDMLYAVFNATCNKAALKTVVMNIEEKVRACPELVAVTSLSTLDSMLDGLSFTTLFENFATYDGFCDCFPGVLAAKALNEKAAQAPNGLVLNRSDGAYSTLVNLSVVCALGPTTFEHAYMYAFNSTCNLTSLHADVFPQDRVLKMRGFAEHHCTADFDSTPFDCALQKASTQEFKFCIDIVTSNTGDDASEKEIKCERKKCVDTYIEGNKESPQCGLNASIQYRWSVIMAGGAIEVSDSVCGASGLFISAVLLFAALLVTRMF